MLGKRFAWFELKRRLGRGGVGDVYLATDTKTGQDVALKLIWLDTADPEAVEYETRGAGLQRDLGHRIEEIASVFEIGTEEGHLYISMEYVEGNDLSEILQRGAIPAERAVGIACQLCRILELAYEETMAMHGRRFVHGDIKPANIRLEDANRVRLLDFGVAKTTSLIRQATHNVFGSLPYLSPERLLHGVADHHADLWAVAVVLYQMISSELPYSGSSSEELARQHAHSRPHTRLQAPCPHGLPQLLGKCLSPQVAARYQSPLELRMDLERILRGETPSSIRHDFDATRRTVHLTPPAGSSATRRTSVPSMPSRPPGYPTPASTPTRSRPPAGGSGHARGSAQVPANIPVRRHPVIRLWNKVKSRVIPLVLLLFLLGVALTLGEFYSWSQLAKLEAHLESSTDLHATWDLYNSASFLSPLGIALGQVEEDLHHKSQRELDSLFARYREEERILGEEWHRASHWLKEALKSSSRPRDWSAKRVLCDAHLQRARIPETGLGVRPEEELRKVERLFHKAAELGPDLPDPHFALARLYADALPDFSKLEKAIKSAKLRLPYPNDREQCHLGNLFLGFGERAMERAQTLRGEERLELLRNARNSFDAASKAYKKVSAPAVAEGSKRRLLACKRRVQELLSAHRY